jgi:hypothetical protein
MVAKFTREQALNCVQVREIRVEFRKHKNFRQKHQKLSASGFEASPAVVIEK